MRYADHSYLWLIVTVLVLALLGNCGVKAWCESRGGTVILQPSGVGCILHGR